MSGTKGTGYGVIFLMSNIKATRYPPAEIEKIRNWHDI
ncbi:hypothetical protein yrohd0001_13550 [Yersinia rohdei ATCC 43380]|nr:hypothetical protein yrohd0001_13550 [Yersinia rohdei ATCC 43380]